MAGLMKIPVLVTRRLFPASEALLARRFTVLRGRGAGARARGALVQLTDRIDARFLGAHPLLEVVSQCAVGVDNIDQEEAARRGIAVMNTPGVLTEATADFTWALVLAVARRVVEGDRLCRAAKFRGWDLKLLLGVDLAGATLGIIGPGRIGTAVARRAAAFGMRVVACGPPRRRPAGARTPQLDGMPLRRVPLARLLAMSDVVSVHVPGSEATRHLIGAAELARVKPGAILINTSRGTAVDEKALIAALRAGRLRGAGLDVFEREPSIPAALRRLPQVVLAPHIASATAGTREAMARTAAQNLVDFFHGRPDAGRLVVPPGRLGSRGGR
jgi:glyoxylate reductase